MQGNIFVLPGAALRLTYGTPPPLKGTQTRMAYSVYNERKLEKTLNIILKNLK